MKVGALPVVLVVRTTPPGTPQTLVNALINVYVYVRFASLMNQAHVCKIWIHPLLNTHIYHTGRERTRYSEREREREICEAPTIDVSAKR